MHKCESNRNGIKFSHYVHIVISLIKLLTFQKKKKKGKKKRGNPFENVLKTLYLISRYLTIGIHIEDYNLSLFQYLNLSA